MFAAVGNKVLHLKRLRMGTLYLDEKMEAGECRRLTAEEVQSLKDRWPSLENVEAVIFDVDGTMADSCGCGNGSIRSIWEDLISLCPTRCSRKSKA